MTLHASIMKDLELFLTFNTCWGINEFLVILNFALLFQNIKYNISILKVCTLYF